MRVTLAVMMRYQRSLIDALEAFDEMSVKKSVMSFVVYILWLKRQQDSFEKYLQVRDNSYDLWRSCMYRLWML